MTLRLRLTLLYGACFLVAGGGVLAITYALVAHDSLGVKGEQVSLGGAAAGVDDSVLQLSYVQAHAVAVRTRPPSGGAGNQAGGGVGFKPFTRLSAGTGPALPAASTPSALIARLKKATQAKIAGLVKRARVALAFQRSQSLNSLITKSAFALGIMALLSIGLGWLLAGRALNPLRTINQRARAITAENLDARIGLEGRRDELGELAGTFDGVLGRLEQAFEAQRRFVANASHELRTPLTLERALIEVALADPEASTESLRQTCERVLAGNAQQERLIDALLTLARSQAGLQTRRIIDLADLCADMLDGTDELEALSVESRLAPAMVSGDSALLERLLVNLLENARAYNLAQGGWIRVQTGRFDGRPGFLVANSGPAVPPDRVDDLFEPFRRLGGERLSAGGGVGLGLSIVKAIVGAHGASISASALEEGGLEIRIGFPVPVPTPGLELNTAAVTWEAAVLPQPASL